MIFSRVHLGIKYSTIFFTHILFFYSPPNLKTATPLSRTQLKLQLMREQALQEQQRRQAQEKAQKDAQMQYKPASPIMRVPLHSIPVEVPPQILQVHPF